MDFVLNDLIETDSAGTIDDVEFKKASNMIWNFCDEILPSSNEGKVISYSFKK